MNNRAVEAAELQLIYRERFESTRAYRARVWKVLIDTYFARFFSPNHTVLDLGCGYGEFINNVNCAKRYGMDLNPDSRRALQSDVVFLEQDCSTTWEMASDSLDLVFTSNFFEHLPSKAALAQTLEQAWRCLKSGGRIVAMGPNIRRVGAAYWDFWDHHLALSHLSLAEGLRLAQFNVEQALESFMPYTLVDAPEYPLAFVRIYLRIPIAWKLLGRQFVVVGRKPATT